MGLLDDLRGIEDWPPSEEATPSEAGTLLGRLAAYVEHGDKLTKAADKDRKAREAGEPAGAVHELLGGAGDAGEDAGGKGSGSSSSSGKG